MQYLWSIHTRYPSISVEELKLVASTTPVVKLAHKRASYRDFECNNHSAIFLGTESGRCKRQKFGDDMRADCWRRGRGQGTGPIG